MPEDFEQDIIEDEDDDETESVWDMLKMDDPGDEYEDEQDDADEEDAATAKMNKKLSSKIDKMDKKFETQMLRERTKSFEAGASELQIDLFKAVAGDIKTVADFDKAVALVVARSGKMEAAAEQYRLQMEQGAAQQVANAWGTGPMGVPQAKKAPDAEEESFKKIAAGDVNELYNSLVGDDGPWNK